MSAGDSSFFLDDPMLGAPVSQVYGPMPVYTPPVGGDQANDVFPTDATVDLLNGQGFMPTGTADISGSDATGQNAVYSNPNINPNPTGGWQTILKTVLSTANNAFTTFAKGSPSVATPPVRESTTSFFGSNSTLGKPIGTVGGVSISGSTLLFVGLGVAVLGILVWKA